MGIHRLGTLDKSRGSNSWQISVSIAPSYLLTDKTRDRAALTQILIKLYQERRIESDFFLPNNESEYSQSWDGTTSSQGLDRDDRGSEIRLYLPDDEPIAQYKTFLLELWLALQRAGVVLMYKPMPHEHKIEVDGLPSPFSVTRTDARQVGSTEHGMLFKPFDVTTQAHPLLNVTFTRDDLHRSGINYSSATAAAIQYHANGADPIDLIRKDIESIAKIATPLRDLLSNNLRETLKKKITATKQKRDSENRARTDNNPGNRASLDSATKELIRVDTELTKLIAPYPHQHDAKFSDHFSMCRLRSEALNENEVDEIFDELCDGKSGNHFTKLLDRIKADYRSHIDAGEKTPTTSNTLKIDYSKYFDIANLDDLIEKDPRGMQVIYRRIVLLEREQQLHQLYSNNDKKIELEADKQTANISQLIIGLPDMVTKAIDGIDRYEKHASRTLLSHGLFSRMFEPNYGLVRAKHLRHKLNKSKTLDPKDQALALYALLAATDGYYLKAYVCERLKTNKNEPIYTTRRRLIASLKEVLKNLYKQKHPTKNKSEETAQCAQINADINEIVSCSTLPVLDEAEKGNELTRGQRLIDITTLAVEGINSYRTLDRTIETLGFFSRVFERYKGLNRANYLLERLNNKKLDQQQRALTLYALLAANDGHRLKDSVCNELKTGSETSQQTRRRLLDELKGFLKEIYIEKNPTNGSQSAIRRQLDQINHDVGEIVRAANNAKRVEAEQQSTSAPSIPEH